MTGIHNKLTDTKTRMTTLKTENRPQFGSGCFRLLASATETLPWESSLVYILHLVPDVGINMDKQPLKTYKPSKAGHQSGDFSM